MRSRWFSGVATGALFLMVATGSARAGVDQWDFNGDLSASTGPGTLTADAVSPPANLTFTTAVINGETAQVASFGSGTFLRMAHGFPPNGGGAYVNQYTVIMDVLLLDTATTGYASLWQTNTSNANDGDWFVKNGAGVGISGVYGGSVPDGVWHRLALVVDLVAGTFTSYINGVQVQQITLADDGDLTLDGRWSLDPEALVFADNDGEESAGLINCLQFRDEALSAGTIATYGGPKAFGLPASIAVDFTQPDGPPEGWYVIHPNVTVESGVLALTPGGAGEATVLGGVAGQPLWLDSIQSLEFDLAFPGTPPDWPNDHGGFIFCCQNPSDRWGNTGYLIDYLAGNFRCLEMPGGAQLAGKAGVTTYEGRWRVELTDTTIRFLFNGVEQFTVADSRWRGGYVGFWDYTNPGQKMTVDNIVGEFTPAACPTLTPSSVVGTVAGPRPVVNVRIPTLYNLPGPYQVTVTSADPSVAAPAGHTNGSLVVTFEQFGPQSKAVEIELYKEGETQLSVSAPGQDCDEVTTRVEVWKEVTYCDDFTQPDGPPDGWVVVRGTVLVESGQLTLAFPTTGEIDTYAGQGGQALNFSATSHIEFDLSFPGKGTAWPYEHGGVIFCAQSAANGRYQSPGACYVVDFLPTAPGDNTGGRFRCSKFVNGTEIELWNPAPTPGLVYEGKWAIDLTATDIKFSFNGSEVFTVTDSTYRNGHVGFWAYEAPAENKMAVDNLCIVSAANPCPTISPASASNRPVNPKTVFSVAAPFGSNFSADYAVTVTSTHPEVAAPVGGTNGVLVLNFPVGAPLVQTFEAECIAVGTTEFVLTAEGATCPRSLATFTVPEPGVSQYCDDFTQADGAPLDWTVFRGNWQVAGGKLVGACSSADAIEDSWIWAGSPPIKFEGAPTYQFSADLSQATPDGIGPHAGFMLFASAPKNRQAISGYEIDWIDRTNDHGYRLLRYDNGVSTVLKGLVPTMPPGSTPGKIWKVEIDGDTIRLFADGQFIFDVVDPTYRDGYFGFWTFCDTTQAAYDNLVVGDCAAPLASFTATPETGTAPLDVAFDASASTDDVGIVSYSWDFGDLTTGTGALATHTYASDGTYGVVLTVADASGKVATAEKVVIVTPAGTRFVRGDADSSGSIDLSDGIVILNYLFLGGEPPVCLEAADTDDTGDLLLTDAVIIFNWLFLGGSAPQPPAPSAASEYPGADCALDPTPDDLGCTMSAPVCQ